MSKKNVKICVKKISDFFYYSNIYREIINVTPEFWYFINGTPNFFYYYQCCPRIIEHFTTVNFFPYKILQNR